jgi:TolA-binding protein
VRSKKPELSIEIEKVVLKALEKDKDKRYQSVAELHSAFQEAVENSVATIKSGSARPLLFVGSFIILVFGLGIFLLSGGTGEKEEVVVAAKESPTPGLTPVPTPTELPTDVPTSPPATPELVSPPVVVTLYVPPSALPSIAEPVSPEPTSEIVPEPPQSVAPPEAEPTQTTEPTPTPLPVVPTPFMRQESESRAVAAIDVEKLDSVAAYRKAEQLYRAKRYAEAVPYYEFTIKKDPNFKKARLSLGICYQRISRMQDALNQFKLALKLDPTYPPTLFDLACWYSVSGNTEEALRWLEKAIQYEPAVRRWAASERDLSPLKNHPRYKVLLQR